jgi:CDP-glucose 4,6-dehydratase
VTGHTGFKGAWLALLLQRLGAQVSGFALAPERNDQQFVVAGLAAGIDQTIADVRDLAALSAALDRAQPEIVMHLAAQPLVRAGYRDPVGTYSTNVMGTVNLLESIRHTPSVRAGVIVTSDKCYDNDERGEPYIESDRLGGRDPYSNSKAATELVTAAYTASFFGQPGAPGIATARAGNVIGGGDWAADRLLPDLFRAIARGETLRIRSPNSVRPWQHVLDPLLGYLTLAERLHGGGEERSQAFNFGPSTASELPVSDLIGRACSLWGPGARWELDDEPVLHEASQLRLSSEKARAVLGWEPLIGIDEALALTVDWYRSFSRDGDMRALSLAQVDGALSRWAHA